jgi:large subunit ribosomal protein L23
MNSNYDIIKALIRTEKSTVYEPLGKYLFLVSKSSNKTEIKKAVETIYKVKVKAVNTSIYLGKMKRVRYQVGTTADFKTAIVTLKAGQKIDVA